MKFQVVCVFLKITISLTQVFQWHILYRIAFNIEVVKFLSSTLDGQKLYLVPGIYVGSLTHRRASHTMGPASI